MRPIRLARLEAVRGEAQSLCFAPPRRRRPCSSSAATAAARALATGRRQRASSAFRSSPFLIHLTSNLDSPNPGTTNN
uniref:Uncharacterized protein n=1 Tax=Oryza meridionalis TaxID=40149 RepID=A0A0E0F337_9ORYZ